MCDPVTLMATSLAITGAQTVTGMKAANQQYKAGSAMAQQNADNAAQSTARTYSNIGIRAQQEGQAAHQQKQASEIETARAVASAELAAGAGGVTGLSVDAVLRDIYAQAGRNEVVADNNLQMSRDYLTGEMTAAEASGQNQINAMPQPERPDHTALLLGGFASGLNSYTNYKAQKES